MRSLVNDATKVFQRLTCLKFMPRTDEKDYVAFTDKDGY